MRWCGSAFLISLWVLWFWLGSGLGYNLEIQNSLGFSGPSGSLFGYSVLLHRQRLNKWLVVGAPQANSSYTPWIQSPGVIYKCRVTTNNHTVCQQTHTEMGECGKTCQAESAHQWLGVSLSRQPGNGHILACGHRWKNIFYSNKDSQSNKLPQGVCYHYGNQLTQTTPLIPCYRDHQWRFGEDYVSCQAGISNFLTEDLMIMGAPGTSYWTGSVLVFNSSSGVLSAYLDNDSGAVQFGSYLGYSVGAGCFLHAGTTEVVGGAPQHSQTGKVFIFAVDDNMLKIITDVSGDKLGSYFGASVCAVDLNADGLSDLLVGAPFTTSTIATGVVREEGRVHAYINHGEAKLFEVNFKLMGSDSYAAHFGETIIDLGDIDDDGYHDVAVGAPQEEDLRGAIYIYNGRKEGITQTFSQRICGSVLGRDLRMFGQSLSSGVDIDDNGYQDVAIGSFLSDSAVILRTRPVVRIQPSLLLPESINSSLTACQQDGSPSYCTNISVCFTARSRQYRGILELEYNLTADIIHKSFFPHRFYFHGNGTSNSTTGRVRVRNNQLTCTNHLAYLRREVRDLYTAVHFLVSFALKETSIQRGSRGFTPLKPILHQTTGTSNTITNQTWFARSCSLANCSTNLQLSAQLLLPQSHSDRQYFAVGNVKTIILNTTVTNSGDDAFLPQLLVRFPDNVHYIKVLDNDDSLVNCDVVEDISKTSVGVDCSISSFYLPAQAKLNINFLLDVGQNSTAGDIIISAIITGDNYERDEFLHDNSARVILPLRYGVGLSIHGFVSPTSFFFGDQDQTPVDCYTESFNFTYKLLNTGPSRSVSTVMEIYFPSILTPYSHRLLQLTVLQVSQGNCSISPASLLTEDDCDVPTIPFVKQLFFFFSSTSTRRMFCAHGDTLCERLVCIFGDVEPGREATIQLEARINPSVLQQSRHSVILIESTAVITSPREDNHTVLVQPTVITQVVVDAHFKKWLSAELQVFIVVISLILGLMILAALIYCLWKAGFFKRELLKEKRDSWDYVPKNNERESTS